METQAPFRHSSDVLSYTPGQAIFRRGERGDQMYVVLEGEVDLVAGYSVLETAGPGALVGELSLVDRRPRSASAIARTPCKLVPVDAKRFSFMIQETPGFALRVMRTMADRLRAMDTRMAA
jgi:CRP/FNR family cyclic AMP-dependent transcriptional regulator